MPKGRLEDPVGPHHQERSQHVQGMHGGIGGLGRVQVLHALSGMHGHVLSPKPVMSHCLTLSLSNIDRMFCSMSATRCFV